MKVALGTKKELILGLGCPLFAFLGYGLDIVFLFNNNFRIQEENKTFEFVFLIVMCFLFGNVFLYIFLKSFNQLYWEAYFTKDKIIIKHPIGKEFIMEYDKIFYVGVVLDIPKENIQKKQFLTVYMSYNPVGEIFRDNNMNQLIMTEETIKFLVSDNELKGLSDILPDRISKLLKQDIDLIKRKA